MEQPDQTRRMDRPCGGTDAQWAPMSDEDWAAISGDDMALDAAGYASSTGAAGAGEPQASAADDAEWLTPAATIVRPRVVNRDVPTAAAPSPQPILHRSRRRAAAPNPYEYDASSRYDCEPKDERPRARYPHKRARHGCLSVFLWLIMLGVLGLLSLRLLPSNAANGRMVPEFVSFVPLTLAPIIVCLALAAWWRRRLLLVVCVTALAVAAWWHKGYFLPTARVSDAATVAVQSAATAGDSAARIMTLNTANGHASAEDVVALVRAQNVEILCLQELTDSFIVELQAAGIGNYLPYYVISEGASSVSNGGRNGIWTLAPMSNVSGNLLPIETSSMPAANISIGGRTLRVVSVHPNSPVRGAQDLWDRGLSVIGSLSNYDHTYLVMGDFNSTWNHARFRELLGTSFVDASEQSGEGFHMTYPSDGLMPPLVEIDHIVYAKDSGVVVSGLSTVKIAGTDHQALLGTLEVS